jgi:hypothetical protein
MKRNLSKWSHTILRALAEVVKPRSAEFNLDLANYLDDFVDRYVGYFPLHLRLGFPMGLLLLEFGPIIFSLKFSRFSKLSIEERTAHVKLWNESKMAARRDLIKGVKALVLVGFYSHPKVMEHIGYDIEAHIKAAQLKAY